METSHAIAVTDLDAAHRRALEDVIGVQLRANQRLTILVTEAGGKAEGAAPRRAKILDDLAKIYQGLSDEQIEAIDRDINTRANLTRNLP